MKCLCYLRDVFCKTKIVRVHKHFSIITVSSCRLKKNRLIVTRCLLEKMLNDKRVEFPHLFNYPRFNTCFISKYISSLKIKNKIFTMTLNQQLHIVGYFLFSVIRAKSFHGERGTKGIRFIKALKYLHRFFQRIYKILYTKSCLILVRYIISNTHLNTFPMLNKTLDNSSEGIAVTIKRTFSEHAHWVSSQQKHNIT